MTNSDGTMSTLTDDLLGADALVALVAAVWACASTGVRSKAAIVMNWRTER
jgi:hypothetical protein